VSSCAESRKTTCSPLLSIATALLLLVSGHPPAASAQDSSGLDVVGASSSPRAPGMPGSGFLPPDLDERIPGAARSWKDMRDAGVVRQAFDYSCGAAALATLLTAADSGVDERSILLEVLEGLSEQEKSETLEAGLSLLDLKRVSEARGHRAEGYRVDAEFLLQITRPVIVFIKPQGYRHFAVLRGIRGDRIFLADPARGNIRLPAWKFLEMWQEEDGKGVIFVVGAKSSPMLAVAPDAPEQPEIAAVRQEINLGHPDVRHTPHR
jgi:predicted double-glycine peptidase